MEKGAPKKMGSVAKLAALYGGAVAPTPTAPEHASVMGIQLRPDGQNSPLGSGWQKFDDKVYSLGSQDQGSLGEFDRGPDIVEGRTDSAARSTGSGILHVAGQKNSRLLSSGGSFRSEILKGTPPASPRPNLLNRRPSSGGKSIGEQLPPEKHAWHTFLEAEIVLLDPSHPSNRSGNEPVQQINAAVVVRQADTVDERMDETACAELYVRRTLLRSFGAIANALHRRRHVEGAGYTISMTCRVRRHIQVMTAWRGYSSRKAFIRRRINVLRLKREAQAHYRLTELHRAVLVVWSAHARDCRRVKELAGSMYDKHEARRQMTAIDGWSSLISLKKAGRDVAVQGEARLVLRVVKALRRYTTNRLWSRAAVICGLERAARVGCQSVLEAWSGRVRHVDHLRIAGDRLASGTRCGAMQKNLVHWLDWVRASKRGDHVAVVRILRGWCNAAAAAASVQMIGMIVSDAHLCSTQFEALRCWSRHVSLGLAARDMARYFAEQRFRVAHIAWFRESHLRTRLRRARGVLAVRVAERTRREAFAAWAHHAGSAIMLRDVDGRCAVHLEGVICGRVVRAWNAVAWRSRVLARLGAMLRAKVVRMVAGSCMERWGAYTIGARHKAQVRQQEGRRVARSAARLAMAGWQQELLYRKCLKVGEDKASSWTRAKMMRSVCAGWMGVSRASALSRKLSMRRTTRGWKEGAWAKSCHEASNEVAARYSGVKLLKSAMHGWDVWCREEQMCEDFRAVQVYRMAIKGWRGEVARVRVHAQCEEQLRDAFVLDGAGRRLGWLLKEWAHHVDAKLTREGLAAPLVARSKRRPLHAAAEWWSRWGERRRATRAIVWRLREAKEEVLTRGAMTAWRGRVHYVLATVEGVDEGLTHQNVSRVREAFDSWVRARTYMIQIISAEQYTEEATATYCVQAALEAWAGRVGYLARLRDTGAVVEAAHQERVVMSHVRHWSDWAVASGLGAVCDLRGGLRGWKAAVETRSRLRFCGEEIKATRGGWCAVTALRGWRAVSKDSRAACRVTGVTDPREAHLRRRGLSKVLGAWLGRIHTKVAMRDICYALAIKTARNFMAMCLREWRVAALRIASCSEASEAIGIRCEMGAMHRVLTTWRGLVRKEQSERELGDSLFAARCDKVLASHLSLWVKHSRAQAAMAACKVAVASMYAAKVLAKYLKRLGRYRVWSQGMAERAERGVRHDAGKRLRRVWVPWAMRAMVWSRSCAEAGSRAELGDKVLLQGLAKAWWVVAMVDRRNQTGLLLDVFSEWKTTEQEDVFHRKALPMADFWCTNKLLAVVMREWFIASIEQKKYSAMLSERYERDRRAIIPAVMQAWFQVAVRNEKMWECHDAVQVRMSEGVRGRMFGKWARCMHRGRLFSEAYYITLDRHKMRMVVGVLRMWGQRVLTSEYKALLEDRCDALAAMKRKARAIRIVRGWFQAVVVLDVMRQVIRKKQMQGAKPPWLQWRLATMRLIERRGNCDVIATSMRRSLMTRAWRGWRAIAPYMALLALSEGLVERRAQMSLQKRVVEVWSRHLYVAWHAQMLMQSRVVTAWRQCVGRVIWCERAAWAHDMPRRVKTAQTSLYGWRMVAGRAKYRAVAVEKGLDAHAKRIAKRLLTAWSAYVGAVWPMRFASFSAVKMAGVKVQKQNLMAWARYMLLKKTQRRSAARMGARGEEGVVSDAMREWCKAAAAASQGRRTLVGKAWSGWAHEAENSIMVTGNLAARERQSVTRHFEAWWVHSARLEILRDCMGSVRSQITAQFAAMCLTMWSLYALKCSAADEQAVRGPLRAAVRAWRRAAASEAILKAVVSCARTAGCWMMLARYVEEWRVAAWDSRRHRKAKKHIRRCLDMSFGRYFGAWRGVWSEEARLSNAGLEVLIAHNRRLAEAGFDLWIEGCSDELSKANARRRQGRLEAMSASLHGWFGWSSRRFYGDAVQQHLFPPKAGARGYGDLNAPVTPIVHGPGVSPPPGGRTTPPRTRLQLPSPERDAMETAARSGGAAGAAAVLAEAIKRRQLRAAQELRAPLPPQFSGPAPFSGAVCRQPGVQPRDVPPAALR